MQPLKHFLQATHIDTQSWFLGQYCNTEHLGQGDIQIAGQGTVNNRAEEHQSETGGHDDVVDDDEQGEGVEWQKAWI
jgi:hypothetical protein